MAINHRKLVESLLSVAGIWLLARQIPDYATAVVLFLSDDLAPDLSSVSVLGIQFIHFATSVAVGALLIFSRGRISRWVHPSETSSEPATAAILAAGVSILAVFFVTSGIMELGSRLSHRYGTNEPWWFLDGGLTVLLGSLLFVSTNRICLFWEKVNARADEGA